MDTVEKRSSTVQGQLGLRAAPRFEESKKRYTLCRYKPMIIVCAFASALTGETACAHGFAGKRFFPATLTTEDPFVADELSLPTIASRKTGPSGDEPATRETEFSTGFTKRVTQDFGVGFDSTYLRLQPEGGERRSGFDNVAVNAKYQFYRSDAREAILSAGVDWDIGGSGSKRVGAESFSTITPALFFGKGLGDLPDSAKFLRPLALTGLVGIALPTRKRTTTITDAGDVTVERHPDVLKWGFSVQYSIPYLQSFVKDVGLREPLNRLVPVIEFALQTPLNRGGGPTTGTVNPGILWAGRYVQVGIEAVIPINSNTGGKTGVIAQLHFFLDDLFPKSIGRPLFGQ